MTYLKPIPVDLELELILLQLEDRRPPTGARTNRTADPLSPKGLIYAHEKELKANSRNLSPGDEQEEGIDSNG